MLNLNSFRLSESQVLQKIITGSNAGNVCTIHSKYHTCILPILTRGPRGPWVAHLRKRSKVTVEPIIENPRGII